jgi:sugar (pentulose or hexulose) kinase
LLEQLILGISEQLKQLDADYRIRSVSIDGTSGTLIACKKDGTALSPALMYNDQQALVQAERISQLAPADSAVHGPGSSLAKALLLLERYPDTEIFCFQADWLASSLTGVYGISDENNCLKMGYDCASGQWPEWLFDKQRLAFAEALLPEVVAPGTVVARVKPALLEKYRMATNCVMVAGTTDSNAAVLATGATRTGDAVTSLGSTLVVKVFADRPLFDARHGIYSHHLNGRWLVGGASNSGGSVLLQHFTQQQLDEMTPQLNPEQPTGLDYYPLPATGERFPVNDSNKADRTSPRPASDVMFFQGLLEGIARIEAKGYNKLKELGAPYPKIIYTMGGGNKNRAWNKIRERITGAQILTTAHSEACYGSAKLARKAVNSEQ